MPVRTEVFIKLVRDHMGSPPLVAGPETPCTELIDRVRAHQAGSAAFAISP